MAYILILNLDTIIVNNSSHQQEHLIYSLSATGPNIHAISTFVFVDRRGHAYVHRLPQDVVPQYFLYSLVFKTHYTYINDKLQKNDPIPLTYMLKNNSP